MEMIRLQCGIMTRNAVSYTHLDVYKRQASMVAVDTICSDVNSVPSMSLKTALYVLICGVSFNKISYVFQTRSRISLKRTEVNV